MKLLKCLISISAIFAATSAFAQNAAPAQQAPAPAVVEVSDGVKIAMQKVGDAVVVKVDADSSKMKGKSNVELIESLLDHIVDAAGLVGMQRVAVHSALHAILPQLSSGSANATGVVSASFKIDRSADVAGAAVVLEGVVKAEGKTIALDTKTQQGANGVVNTTGNVTVTSASGQTTAPAPVAISVDAAGNITGSVGNSGVAAKTPEAQATQQAVTPTSQAGASEGNVTPEPDNTIITSGTL